MKNKQNEMWKSKFYLLCEYLKKTGEFPSAKTVYNGVNLGKWCAFQRKTYKDGKLSDERKTLLNGIGFEWTLR